MELESPSAVELKVRCIRPSVPARIRGALRPDALAVDSPSALRKFLVEGEGAAAEQTAGVSTVDLLDRAIEVQVADRGAIFCGDDVRRQGVRMPLRDFLSVLEQSADSFEGREDYYLCQCPFLLPSADCGDERGVESISSKIGDAAVAAASTDATDENNDMEVCDEKIEKPNGSMAPFSLRPSDEVPLAPLAWRLRPPECIQQPGMVAGNLWCSPRATRTSPHFDGRHNVLVVLSGCKKVSLWSPTDPQRLEMPSKTAAKRVSAQTAGVNCAIGLAAAEAGCSSSPSHREWPVDGLLRDPNVSVWNNSAHGSGGGCQDLPSNVRDDNVRALGAAHAGLNGTGHRLHDISVQAGEALFIPEGWWHAVKSEPGTIAASYWFPGEHAALEEFRPHTAPYLMRMLAQSMLNTARASLVRACRAQSRNRSPTVARPSSGSEPLTNLSSESIQSNASISEITSTPKNCKEVDVTSLQSLKEALCYNPGETVAIIGRHMPADKMISLLPSLVASEPEAFANACFDATPWGAELLVSTWEAIETSSSFDAAGGFVLSSSVCVTSMQEFYDAIFNVELLGEHRAEAVRRALFEKRQAFGRRLLPLLLNEIGVFNPAPNSGVFPPSITTLNGNMDQFQKDMREVRSLMNLMAMNDRIYVQQGVDGGLL